MSFPFPDSAKDPLSPEMVRALDFILKIDKLKSVVRRSPLLDGSRAETDAEHSWHLAMIAMVLAPFAPKEVNIDRVIRMVLIHDIVEIEAGDTFLYDAVAADSQAERETRAADHLFGLLPEPLAQGLRTLWGEFEAGRSADARFAKGIDRLQPLLLNYGSGGGAWNLPGVHKAEVLARQQVIEQVGAAFWRFGRALIVDGAERGWLRAEDPTSAGAPRQVEPFDRVRVYPDLAAAPDQLVSLAGEFSNRYGKPFNRLVHFPEGVLDAAHAEGAVEPGCAMVTVASAYDTSAAAAVDRMGRVANSEAPSLQDHQEFFAVVLEIYRSLRGGAGYLTSLNDSFVLAPEREGRYIAEALDLLPADRAACPNAKRMPHGEDGLVVGLDIAPLPETAERCVIIDGAIASGSTLMALIEYARRHVREFHVFSAHTTASSVRALSRYAGASGIRLYLNIGHVSGALNKKRYALNPDGSLVIGDLGDLISPAVA